MTAIIVSVKYDKKMSPELIISGRQAKLSISFGILNFHHYKTNKNTFHLPRQISQRKYYGNRRHTMDLVNVVWVHRLNTNIYRIFWEQSLVSLFCRYVRCLLIKSLRSIIEFRSWYWIFFNKITQNYCVKSCWFGRNTCLYQYTVEHFGDFSMLLNAQNLSYFL